MTRETGRTLPTWLGEIHVRQRGEGPSAVLWHSLFVGSRSWGRVEDRLAQDGTLMYRALQSVMLDRPDFDQHLRRVSASHARRVRLVLSADPSPSPEGTSARPRRWARGNGRQPDGIAAARDRPGGPVGGRVGQAAQLHRKALAKALSDQVMTSTQTTEEAAYASARSCWRTPALSTESIGDRSSSAGVDSISPDQEDVQMVAAYVLVSVEPGKNEPVVSALRDMPQVKQAHSCWGKPDIFAFVEVESDSALAQTVLTQIQTVAGVRDTETHIVVPV